jgi:hypothetical protein
MTTAAAEGDKRAAPPAAVQVLRQILAARAWREPPKRVEMEEYTRDPARLLPEWIALARGAGAAVPPELLPEMLEFGRRNAEFRDAVAAAAGEHGEWLAARNPPWAYAAAPPADPGAAWEAGTAQTRLRILRHLRSTDPGAGLALLRSTWAAEARDDRLAFLDALETGLSLDDEPFLESVLDEPLVEPVPSDDNRMISSWIPPREVRPTVVNLLAMLPGSRLVTRMFARLAPLLTLHEPPGERARIDLRLPAARNDEELRRYTTAPSWVPERAMSMHEMLSVVPPSLWAAQWELGPAELLQAARWGRGPAELLHLGREPEELPQAARSGRVPAELLQDAYDFGQEDLVIRAWTEAAIRVRDGEYAEARLRMPGGKHPGAGNTKVAEVIPPDRLEALVLERLSAHGLAFHGTAPELLRAACFPWSPTLTRAVVEALPAILPADDCTLLFTVDDAAPYVHPATAVAVLRERGDPYQGEWVDLIHLRHTLHQAFQ